MIEKLNPLRSEKYLKFVRSLPCVVTGLPGCEAHHIKIPGFGGTTKCSDLYTIPMTPLTHTKFHAMGWKSWETLHGSQAVFALETIAKAEKAGIIKVI